MDDFEAMIKKLKEWIATLEDSAYKEGMEQALKDAGCFH